MRYFVITDSTDTLVGLRLAGIEGTIARDSESAHRALAAALEDHTIGVLLLTENLEGLCKDVIDPLKRSAATPLVLVIPDRHTAGRSKDSITRYIQEAIGIKL